jgi:site-specific recombinase XerD
LRAYESDYKDFSAFCVKNNFSSLPADPKILSLYLTHLSKTSKFSTLKRRIASVSVIHKLKGYYIDTKHPIIRENLLGIKRTKGSNQKAKKPILINDLKCLIEVIHQSSEKDSRKKRDKAIILIGYSGGFRRSELVSIDYEDLEFVAEGVKIFVKRSKTDQSGEGMTKAIPYFENEDFCPVIALKSWIELSKIKKDKFIQS